MLTCFQTLETPFACRLLRLLRFMVEIRPYPNSSGLSHQLTSNS
ncbi:unnamed protein product [Callosobruchus maculatus]|uniref:Uncharacterized protein n=1 Tax=Callosobruchus maculatus TaxID=64391 RepID=A0A653BEB0_CALMS|nr:unnamed protein product [Callosobruchus maculatus]